MQEILDKLNANVPKELSMNVDYWYSITESIRNGCINIPNSFLNYLSSRFDISIEDLKSKEAISLLERMSMYLYKNQGIINNLQLELTTTYVATNKKAIKKNREKLVRETPLAEFNI